MFVGRRLNIWGYIATVPACSSGALINVLPHRNAMSQTQDMTPTLSQYTDTGPTCRCATHWCRMSLWNTHLPILMSLVRPNWEIHPDLPLTKANAQLDDAVMVVVSQKLCRKCTVLAESWTWDLWHAHLLRYLLIHSCFLI